MRTKYKSKFYFTAGFLLPAIILAISFALIKVWPFGDKLALLTLSISICPFILTSGTNWSMEDPYYIPFLVEWDITSGPHMRIILQRHPIFYYILSQ